MKTRTLRSVDVTPLDVNQLTGDERAILVNGLADILLEWAIAEIEREDREREPQPDTPTRCPVNPIDSTARTQPPNTAPRKTPGHVAGARTGRSMRATLIASARSLGEHKEGLVPYGRRSE